MPTTPFSHWLVAGKASLDLLKQFADAGQASVQQAGAHLPGGQAQLAASIKATLDLGQQWKTLQDQAFTSLLHSQLAAFKTQRQSLGLQGLMALQQSLSGDLAAQRQAVLKAVTERADVCVDDLAKAGSKDDIALVISCFLEDVNGKLRENAEQAFTLLNSANAAATLLTHQALDAAIAAAPPR